MRAPDAELLTIPPDARIARVAGAQHLQITTAQLLAIGLSRTQIRGRVRAGRLHPVHRGVLSVGAPPTSPLARWCAALLAAGPGAVLSHTSAGAARAFCPDSAAITITTTRPGAKARPGIALHRVAALDPAEVTRHEGLAITTPARTLLDLAATWPADTLDRALQDARARRLVTDASLTATLRRNEHRPGRPALAAAVAGPFTRSELERRFRALTHEHALPEPLMNAPWHGFQIDAFWPDHRVAAELDGAASHATRRGHDHDERRDAALQAAGFTILRFTWWDVTRDAHRVAHAIRAALAAGAGR